MMVVDEQSVYHPPVFTLIHTTEEGVNTIEFGDNFKGALQAFINRLK